jgi:hypothetical protein
VTPGACPASWIWRLRAEPLSSRLSLPVADVSDRLRDPDHLQDHPVTCRLKPGFLPCNESGRGPASVGAPPKGPRATRPSR